MLAQRSSEGPAGQSDAACQVFCSCSGRRSGGFLSWHMQSASLACHVMTLASGCCAVHIRTHQLLTFVALRDRLRYPMRWRRYSRPAIKIAMRIIPPARMPSHFCVPRPFLAPAQQAGSWPRAASNHTSETCQPKRLNLGPPRLFDTDPTRIPDDEAQRWACSPLQQVQSHLRLHMPCASVCRHVCPDFKYHRKVLCHTEMAQLQLSESEHTWRRRRSWWGWWWAEVGQISSRGPNVRDADWTILAVQRGIAAQSGGRILLHGRVEGRPILEGLSRWEANLHHWVSEASKTI